MMVIWGTFQGAMAATTPTGSRRTRVVPKAPARSSSQSMTEASSRVVSSSDHGAQAWPSREKVIGEPDSAEMSRAISSCRAS